MNKICVILEYLFFPKAETKMKMKEKTKKIFYFRPTRIHLLLCISIYNEKSGFTYANI